MALPMVPLVEVGVPPSYLFNIMGYAQELVACYWILGMIYSDQMAYTWGWYILVDPG